MDSFFFIDGSRDRVDPADRGLAYGDGLFETMLAANGTIRWLEFHLDRLEEGCRRLSIPVPPRGVVEQALSARVPSTGKHIVKLVLTRGVGPRGYAPPADPRVCMLISTAEHSPADGRPVSAVTLNLRLAESEAIAGIKHLCRIEQVLAQLELRERSHEEGVLLSRSGKIVGCTSSNLFLIRESGLLTPCITTAGIAGVMRRVVIGACRSAGIPVEEADVTPEDLRAATGLFQTNAVIGVREIGALDGQRFSAAEQVERVRRATRSGFDA